MEQPRPNNAPRFMLKPAGSRRGFVDGAWWPRSNDPTTEFTDLLSEMTSSAPITRVAHNLTAWNRAPRKLEVQHGQVRIEGFHTLDQHTVSLTDRTGHRTVLLLIPAETNESRANAILAEASARDNVASPHDLLGDDPRSTIPHQAETTPESRWESEGGMVRSERQSTRA